MATGAGDGVAFVPGTVRQAWRSASCCGRCKCREAQPTRMTASTSSPNRVRRISSAFATDVGRRLAEIWRVLKPGGLFQGTMLSKRDVQFGRGRAIAPDTFIRGSDPKAHPHFYCDLAGLAVLFAGFELLSLTQEEQRRPGSWHWHILAERR